MQTAGEGSPGNGGESNGKRRIAGECSAGHLPGSLGIQSAKDPSETSRNVLSVLCYSLGKCFMRRTWDILL